MFSQQELELMKVDDLKNLLSYFGLASNGKAAPKKDLILSLVTFPKIAIAQFAQKQGLKKPGFQTIQYLRSVVEAIGTSTPQQEALIKLSIQGKFLEGNDGQYQRLLFKVYRFQQCLKEAMDILTE